MKNIYSATQSPPFLPGFMKLSQYGEISTTHIF